MTFNLSVWIKRIFGKKFGNHTINDSLTALYFATQFAKLDEDEIGYFRLPKIDIELNAGRTVYNDAFLSRRTNT